MKGNGYAQKSYFFKKETDEANITGIIPDILE
jgi:hypothetical protein